MSETMGTRLRRIRISLNRTQADMSRDLGLGASTWQNYELGTSSPNPHVLSALSKQKFNINWILSGVGGMYQTNFIADSSSFPPEFNSKVLEQCYHDAHDVYAKAKQTPPASFGGDIYREVASILNTAQTESEVQTLIRHYLGKLEQSLS